MAVGRRVDVRDSLDRARRTIGGAARRRDAAAIFVVTTLAYLLVYLWAIQEFSVQPGAGMGLVVVDDPLARTFEPGIGRFLFEPIAVVNLGVAVYLFSPINSGIGLVLSALVGANAALTYLAYVHPDSCGIGGRSTGLLASIPAVLSGGACCAPLLLLAFGITATGTLLTVISWLLPVGFALLVGSLVYLAGQIDASALADVASR